jgi:hypothetical protein
LLLLSAFLLMLTNSASVRAAPELTIGHYELVSSKRITRTVFEYTYKADITNTGTDALDVSATLSITAPGVTVLNGDLSFGDVAAGARVTSSDTFAIRQDRSYSLSESQFIWVIDATSTPLIEWSESPLTLTVAAGTATAASVEISVSQTLSNVQVSVDSVLAPFISVFPEAFDTLNAGATEKISLWVSVPAATTAGRYEGTLHLRRGNLTLNAHLPIVINVVPLQAVDVPNGLIPPSAERVVEDQESGVILVKDEIMVTLASGVDPSAAHAVADALGGKMIGGFPELRRYQIQVPAQSLDELWQSILAARGMTGIETANGHYFLESAAALPQDGVFTPTNQAQECTEFAGNWNETSPWGCNWGLELIRLPSAWALPATGNTGVKIAVIDTGFFVKEGRFHVDFYPKGATSNGNIAKIHPNPNNADERLQDHGTFVAGVLAAKGNNQQGITGTMWDASLLVCPVGYWSWSWSSPLKGKAAWDFEEVAKCFAWAQAEGAHVINFSGRESCTISTLTGNRGYCVDQNEKWRNILENSANSLVVVAAGNDEKLVEENPTGIGLNYVVPAHLASSFDNVISVAAVAPPTEPGGAPTWRQVSNYGAAVTIAAPGYLVYTLAPNDEYAITSGTSLSAPFVSGVAGLMLSVNPALTPPQLKQLLEVSAQMYVTSPDKRKIPVLNAAGAVKLAAAPPSTKFSINDTVEFAPDISGSLLVWDLPDRTVIGTQEAGARGTVVEGPRYSATMDFWMWKVDFDTGADGWVAEQFLRGTSVSPGTPITDIDFADSNLRQCVLDAATASGWQTVEQVTALSCAERDITSLAGLESFINLQTLALGNNQITDTAPLINLTQLGQLDLTGNNGIRCMELDGLAATLASTTITRPADCISATGTGKLNDTGIDWCANDTTSNLPCPVASHPGQDGDHGRDALARAGQLQKVGGGAAGFDFTKLDANGNALPASATSWDCVRDNVTGLIWEVKTTSGLRDQYHTYTWYNPDPTTNGGNAGVQNGGTCTGSACDTHGFVQAVNQQGLCGAKDWRMPTRRELQGIVDYSRLSPPIDTGYFPNTEPGSRFWSASPVADYSYHRWQVIFNLGFAAYGSLGYGVKVRLVRGGP